jgi:lipopolysaccharide export system permease protein
MPPSTLFNYIASRSLIAFVGLFIVLGSLVMAIDFIENIRYSGGLTERDFGLAAFLTILRTPALIQVLTPFIFLFGSLWTFNQLNRRSEIAVMRSAGLSIWRLIGPAALIAVIAGLFLITVIDPLSSQLMGYSQGLKLDAAGEKTNLMRVYNDGVWLRQRAGATQLIINARSIDEERAALRDVTVWRFGQDAEFLERIDSEEATFADGAMELHDAQFITMADLKPQNSPLYAVRTTLTPADFRHRAAPPETMSLWQLPRYVLLAEAAGLSTVRYNIRFHDLCSTPLKLLAMVLIAAAFSMRPARNGGVMYLAVVSIAAGFLLYLLSEISTAFGESGLAPVALAAWTPAIVATLAATTILLHVEEG